MTLLKRALPMVKNGRVVDARKKKMQKNIIPVITSSLEEGWIPNPKLDKSGPLCLLARLYFSDW